MGASPVGQIVFGVKLLKQENEAFLSWRKKLYVQKGEQDSAIFMMFLESLNMNLLNLYLIQRYFKGTKPFWFDFDVFRLQSMKTNNETFEKEYQNHLKAFNISDIVFHKQLIFPQNEQDDNFSFLGMKYGEEIYDHDLSWCLATIFGFTNKNNFVKVPGTRPWETGTERTKSNLCTLNGENMFEIPIQKIPKKILSLLCSFDGTRQRYHEEKKKAWYKLCPNKKPFFNYHNESWNWSRPNFEITDSFYSFICKKVPKIKYDHLKIEKYILFYWR